MVHMGQVIRKNITIQGHCMVIALAWSVVTKLGWHSNFDVVPCRPYCVYACIDTEYIYDTSCSDFIYTKRKVVHIAVGV